MAIKRDYDFLAYRRPFGIISTLLVVVSLVLLFVPGPKYGIDFAGGTNIIARFNEDVTDGEVRTAAQGIGLTDVSVVRFGGEEGHQFLLQTRMVSAVTPEQAERARAAVVEEFGPDAALEYDETSGDRLYVVVPESAFAAAAGGAELDGSVFASQASAMEQRIVSRLSGAGFDGVTAEMFGGASARRFAVGLQAIQAVVGDGLREAFGDKFADIDRVETVGPRVGEQLRNDAVQAILFALVGILLYVAFRFDLRYAPAAVICLFHDVMITLGVFIVLKEEINLPILAALLTIVGYSLNDTIVNFDRIRENLEVAVGRVDLDALVNRSVNEVLSRTILTTFTTLLAVMAIYVLGGGLVRSFALAMLIGVTVGAYSSVYIANPLMIWTTHRMAAHSKSTSPVTAA